MATIKGTTTDIIGNPLARLLMFAQVQDITGSIAVGNPTRIVSNSNTGRFSIVLAQGDYVVDVGAHVGAFFIRVPSGSGEYEMQSLIYRQNSTDNTGTPNTIPKWDSTGEVLTESSITDGGPGAVVVSGIGNSKVVTTDSSGNLTGTTALGVSNGGTSLTNTAQGDILHAPTAGTVGVLSIGSSGNVMYSNGTLPYWGSLSASLTTQVTGVLPVANGGTGTSTAATADRVIVAGASGVHTSYADLSVTTGTFKLNVGQTSGDRVEIAPGGTPTITGKSSGSNAPITLTASGTGQASVVSGAVLSLRFGSGSYASIHPDGAGQSVTIEDDGLLSLVNSTNYSVTIAPSSSMSSSWTFKLPTTAGTSGQSLKTDGSGNCYWG